MENNNGQPGSAVAPQQQHPQLIKPEQIARLSNLNEDIRKQWINGLQNLWGNLQKHQKGSLEYEQLYRKLIEVSAGIKKNIESMAQRRTGAGQHGNGQQSATNGQHQGQQNNAQSHNPRALQIQEQAKRINVLVPPNILPTDRTKYIQTMRVQFAAQQVNQLTAQQKLKDITTLMNQRTSAGPPLSQEELANVQKNRDQYIKITSNCKAWLDQFQKQQEELRNQQSQQLNASAAPIPTSNDQKELTDATHQGPLPSSQPGQQNSNIPASNAAPATQNAGAANRIQGQEGMGTTNSPVVGTPTQASSQHVPVSQASNSLPAPPTSQPYSQPNSTHPIPPLSQHTFPQQHPTQSNNSPQSLQPHSAAYQGPPRPLSHQAAVAQANQFNVNQSQQSHQNYSQATPQQFHQPQRTPNETPSVNKMPVPKTLSIPTPQPVVMPTARPTLSGGPASSGSGMMGQPAIQKYPAFVLEGEGERVLSKKRLNELVRQVTGGGETLGSEGLSADVEETLLNVADEFVDQVVTSACKLAKLRQSSTLEIRDIQLILERNYNIRIPGYASDELRTVKKFTPAQGWTQKMSAVQASKVTGAPSRSSSPHPKQEGRLSDNFPIVNLQVHPEERPWHRRPRSPDLRWHKDYNEGFCTDGRVLVIDYVKQQASKRGMRKVVAQEIESWEGLQKFYANPSRRDEALLRVFHVQNAPWATRFFLRKFNINDRHPLVGTDFGRYLKRNHFEQRGGKPYLKGKAWKTQHDPWRSISRTMFGLDYMKAYRRHDEDDHRPTFNVQKMMQLNSFDEEDSSMFGWDVYSQRLSCYIQFKEDESRIPAGIKNPYSELPRDAGKGRKPLPHAEDLDNGNTIIIFENSHTGSIEDTLIAARQEWESRWRRLPFYLAFESHDVSSDARLALECMKIILEDVFKSIVNGWEVLLDVCYTHVGILEDRIYEEPADETRAPELWTNSSNWLKVEKIIYVHMDILNELRNNLRDITDEDEDQNTWLVGIPSDFERLKNLIEEDLIKPTANMADLMYKSVGIRDSRHSLRLGVSMWRLSWITFIFLPLNFIVAFFGMNVDTFENDPSLKWFFIVAVPFMCFVLVLWFFTKHMLEQTRQTPYQRGIWDKLFNDLAQQYPKLWSRNGPRDYIRPTGLLARIKWNLILLWSDPSRTGRETSNSDDLGVWSNFKRRLIKRWTGQLRVRASPEDDMFELEEGPDDDGISPLASGMESASEILAAPASSYLAAAAYKASPPLRPDSAPTSTLQIPQTDPYVFLDRTISQPGRMRPPRDSSRESHGSHGQSSGYLVEEEDPNWLKDLKAKTDEVRGWPWGATNLELFRRSLDRQGGEERGAEGSRGGSSGKERQDEKNREKDLENQK